MNSKRFELKNLYTVEDAYDISRTDLAGLIHMAVDDFELILAGVSLERGSPCAKVYSPGQGAYWVFDKELILDELHERFGFQRSTD